MSFSENLQFLRKKQNITQEQLAEQLEVSRQSVSKWESGVTYPEMEKLLQICQMFHCNMDDLMQKDISKNYVEDKAGYDSFQNKFSFMITAGIAIIMLGLCANLLLVGFGRLEAFANMIFFSIATIGIMIMIAAGMQKSYFRRKNPRIEDFYTEEEKDLQYKKHTTRIIVGVGMIFLSLIFKIGSEALPELQNFGPGQTEDIFNSMFLLGITAAVAVLVYGGMQKSKYNIREYNANNEEFKSDDEESTPEQKKRNELIGKICGCIMLVATIVFFVTGFLYNGWQTAWVAYAVGGILCAIVSVALHKSK